MDEEIESKGERRPGESMKDCVGRKIAANIREGKPRDQAVAIAFSQCKLSKDLDLMDDDDLEIALLILSELEADPQFELFMEGVAEDFEFAIHLKRKKKKKKKKKKKGGMYKDQHLDDEEKPAAAPEGVAPPVKEEEEEEPKEGPSGENEGVHRHPHGPNGIHLHEGMDEASGSHNHEGTFGRHKHSDDEPMGGGHVNINNGRHKHLAALGLTNLINQLVDAHWPLHKWIPGFKQAWIKHKGDTEFRTTARGDWVDHAVFNLHSAGCSIEAHLDVFTNSQTRIIEIKYELEDGTVFTPTEKDWKEECAWFKSFLPDVEKFLVKEDVKE